MHPFNQNNSFPQITPRKKIKFYRTKHNTYEAQKFSEQTSYDYEHLKICSEFILDRTNYEKINKTYINLTRFIFSFCSNEELGLKLHGLAYLFKENTHKYFHDLSSK